MQEVMKWCSPYVSRKILALPKRRESWSSERVDAKVFVQSGFEGLKIISAGKDGGRERSQFFEVIGINVLANEVVRHFSNLTAKEWWESAKRVLRAKHALGGITDFNV